jgi:hypothetical protein
LYAEGLMPAIIAKHFQPVISRFFTALHSALPHIPREEMTWRIHFMVGVMAHTMFLPPGEQATPVVIRRIVRFLGAGFRAEVSE